jgi:cation diffusion facilitator family transporter
MTRASASLCVVSAHEFPPDLEPIKRRALRVEWISLVYFISAVTVLALVMGQSRAMRTAWVDDLLGLLTPIAVLVASYFRRREPDRDHPYGFHRAITIAFLVGAVALLALGCLLVFHGIEALVRGDRPTITDVELFGRQIWLGWLMLGALAYSALPTVVFGVVKRKLAEKLHDKALYCDARMNFADWKTGVAAGLGVIGIALGWWWADSVAAIVIAVDIAQDGLGNLRTAVADLIDRRPRNVDNDDFLRLPGDLERAVCDLPWVADAAVRMRECGHVLFGEVFVVPVDEAAPLRRIREVHRLARRLDWRVHDLTVQLVECIDGTIGQVRAGAAPSATVAEPAPGRVRPRPRAAAGRGSPRRRP